MISLRAKLFLRCLVSKISTFENCCVLKHVTFIGILSEVLLLPPPRFFAGRGIYIVMACLLKMQWENVTISVS
jgi:hypothetical protein